MADPIKDGTGSGLNAKVGNKNRLHTHALSSTAASVATVTGDTFNVSSELITLTNTSSSSLLYIENTEASELSLTTLFINIGTSTGGVGKGLIKFHLNPTAGTLITEETDAQVLNRRVGDVADLKANAYKGGQGKTCTGGDEIELPHAGGAIPSEYVIPRGVSFALSYTPPAGNNSIQLQIGFLIIKNYDDYTVE